MICSVTKCELSIFVVRNQYQPINEGLNKDRQACSLQVGDFRFQYLQCKFSHDVILHPLSMVSYNNQENTDNL